MDEVTTESITIIYSTGTELSAETMWIFLVKVQHMEFQRTLKLFISKLPHRLEKKIRVETFMFSLSKIVSSGPFFGIWKDAMVLQDG